MIGTFCLGEELWLHLTLPSHLLFLFSNEQVAFTRQFVRRTIFQIFLMISRIEAPLFCHVSPHLSACNRWFKRRTSKIPKRKLSCASPVTASIPSNFRALLPCSSCEVKVWKTLHWNHGLEAITQLGDCCFIDLITARWETGLGLGWGRGPTIFQTLGNSSSLIGTYSLGGTIEN